MEEKGVSREQLEYLSAIYNVLVEKLINTNRDEFLIAHLLNSISQDHQEWSKKEYKSFGFNKLKEAAQTSIDLFKLDLQIDGDKILRNNR